MKSDKQDLNVATRTDRSANLNPASRMPRAVAVVVAARRRLGLRAGAGSVMAGLASAALAAGPPSALAAGAASTATASPAQSPTAGMPTGAFSGTLVQRHGHALDGTLVEQSWVLRNGSEELPLTDAQPEQLAGQRVTVVDGSARQAGIQGETKLATTQIVAATPAAGPQTVLAMVLTTPDSEPNLSVSQTQQAVFGAAPSASDFYRVESGGEMYLTGRASSAGDVIAVSVSQPVAGCDYTALAASANQVADAQGWPTSSYDHLIYVLPPNSSCTFGGLGDMPGNEVWMNDYLGWNAIAHELGHNMGAHHANLLTCRDAAGNATSYSSDCTSAEYADPYDVMGVHQAEMGAWHRAQIGVLPSSSTLSLKQSASVPMVPAEDFSLGTASLMIPIKTPHQPVTSWYDVDLRNASFPYDWWTSGDSVTTGPTIRIVPDLTAHQQTQLIDTTPETSGVNDEALQPGATFTDSLHSISITARSTSAGLTADVSMPTLVDDVPPGAPPYIAASGDTNGVTVSWGAATDDTGVDHYEVYRDGSLAGTTPGQSFADTNVAGSVSISYAVVAVDASGNKSPATACSVTLPDRTPPAPMGSLTAQIGPRASVVLGWPAGSDNRGVSQYEVDRDGVTVTYTRSLSYTDAPAVGRHTYAVKAVDAAGNVGVPATTDIVVPGNGPSGSGGGSGTTTTITTGTGVSGGGSSTGNGAGRGSAAGRSVAHGPSAYGAKFRLVSYRSRIQRGRRSYSATFAIVGSSSIFATINGRWIGYAVGGRLSVTFAIARHRKQTIVIHGRFFDGTATDSWAFYG